MIIPLTREKGNTEEFQKCHKLIAPHNETEKGTILIPCYNEEHNLPLLYSHLLQLMEDESGFCGSCTL